MWLGDARLTHIVESRQHLQELNQQAKDKKDRNDALYAEVVDLRKGLETIEERARYDLGMTKPNETFFQVLE